MKPRVLLDAEHVDAWAERYVGYDDRHGCATAHAIHWRTLHNGSEKPAIGSHLAGDRSDQWRRLVGLVDRLAKHARYQTLAPRPPRSGLDSPGGAA